MSVASITIPLGSIRRKICSSVLKAWMSCARRLSQLPGSVVLILLVPVCSPVDAAVSNPPGEASRHIALVVGNSAYRSVPKLKNAAKDATDIADSLRRLGYDVTLATNLGKSALADRLSRFKADAQTADVVLFYYSGHGFQLAGVNHIVPVDATLRDRKRIEDETFRLDDIMAGIEGKTRQTLIFLDACRNNPIPQAKQDDLSSGLAQIQGGKGGGSSFVAFATQPGNVSNDGAGENSPFTKALLEHLPTAGIDISSMMIRVRKSVKLATLDKQTPWDQSSLSSEYYFNPVAEAERPTAPDEPGLDVPPAATDVPILTVTLLPPEPAPPENDPLQTPASEVPLITIGRPLPEDGPIKEEPWAPPSGPAAAVTPPVRLEAALVPATRAVFQEQPSPIPNRPAPVRAAQPARPGGSIATVLGDSALSRAAERLDPAPGRKPKRLRGKVEDERDDGEAPMEVTIASIDRDEPLPLPPLAPSAATPPSVDPSVESGKTEREIRLGMQSALKRLGCFSGKVDGDWGSRSKKALDRYYREKGEDGDDTPTIAMLERLEDEKAGLCSREPIVKPPTQIIKKPEPQVAKPPRRPDKPKPPRNGTSKERRAAENKPAPTIKAQRPQKPVAVRPSATANGGLKQGKLMGVFH